MLQTPIERKRWKRVTYQPFIVKDKTKRNIIVFLVSLFSPLAAFNWLRGLTVQMFCRLLLFSHLRFVDSAAFVTMRRDATRRDATRCGQTFRYSTRRISGRECYLSRTFVHFVPRIVFLSSVFVSLFFFQFFPFVLVATLTIMLFVTR